MPHARTICSRLAAASLATALTGFASTAGAQDAPPAAPPGYGQPPPGYPPGYGQPAPGYPPGYGQPPPGYYGSPYGYGAPPAALGPKTMDYEEGQPVPAGYRVEKRIRKGLVIGGAVTFGSTYLLSAITAGIATSWENDYDPLFIPVAGPFVTMGTANSDGFGTFTLALDGVAQAGGLAMFIAGLAAQETLLVRNDVSARRLDVAPLVGRGLVGLGVAGTM